ncbi:Lrp/AsnC family transcriptional regulator [Amycolatopsis saalfeldensis]|nr:Lrp/AsnC family transcriptional regulator [Amycolatopsis saalfeldensis]
MLDDADFMLIHALQLRPRASWSALAPILNSTPVTLARRWERLSAAGLAWITAYPHLEMSESVTALVEVDCAQSRLNDLWRRLAADPRIVTIEHAARGRDLILTVRVPSLEDLSVLLLDDLPGLPGLQSTRAHIAAQFHAEASSWRLDVLEPSQIAALQAIERPRGTGTAHQPAAIPSSWWPIAEALARDGRASAAEIGASIGRPASTVRRQLGGLLRSGTLVFRCEIAQLWSRWPITATWWCRVPAVERDGLVAELRRDPRLRLCLSLTGPTNFLVTMWNASLKDLMRTQERIERLLPAGEIVDTAVLLRTRKRLGWLLHGDGRATGEVVPFVADNEWRSEQGGS